MTFMLASALAASWQLQRESGDCRFFNAPSEGSVHRVRAECYWADVAPATLSRLLADWDRHDDYFGVIAESEVVRREGDRALVRQVHRAPAIPDREMLLWSTSEDRGDTAVFRWELAEDVPFQAGGNRVAAARNDGSWQVRPAPSGGSLIVHELAYDPGGAVPPFLVRWFQLDGLVELVGDLRKVARTEAGAS